MKLLGWMHRKFRQKNDEPLKNFTLGYSCTCLKKQPSFDDEYQYPQAGHGIEAYKNQRDNLGKSFYLSEATQVKEEDIAATPAEAMSELFHGFLAIGTFGSDPNISVPSTPSFANSMEIITKKESEVTESEMKVINDELEKVLGAEAKESDDCNNSSARNSHVSNGRSSHGSTITLSGNNNSGNESAVCPLQGYLFGSTVGLSETTKLVRKEHRTSLAELFQRTKSAEENTEEKFERDKGTEKNADKYGGKTIRKMVRGKVIHASGNSTTASDGTADSALAQTKLHKILKMFKRKLHPESSMHIEIPKMEKMMMNKKKNKNKISYDQMLPDAEITTHPQHAIPEEGEQHHKTKSNPRFTLCSSNTYANTGLWIKTDTDYLILEL